MDRRELIRMLGATAALGMVPSAAAATVQGLHAAVQQGRGFRTLTTAQQALVSRVADLVIPRTDTPGALDVRVPEFIDLLLTEWYDESDARKLLDDVIAIDAAARERGAASFVAMSVAQQVELLRALDAASTETSGAAAGFRQLKSLTVSGYFSSERVTKEVLRTRTYFSRYQGDAPHVV